MGTDSDTNDKHGNDWHERHEIISEQFWLYFDENHRVPTIRKIAELCGMDKDTIHRHFKELDKSPLSTRSAKLRLLTQRVLEATAAAAVTGNAADRKLFFQIMEKWSEKVDMNITAQDFVIKFNKAFDGV